MIEKTTNISRASFLQGQWKQSPIRPPWSSVEEEFLSSCTTSCNACEKACPENIIVLGRGRYPYVDFTKGECTFCERCVDTCESGALDKNVNEHPWQIKAIINMDACITSQQVVCRSCEESCDAAAITFSPKLGGVSTPKMNIENCTGCGACIRVCPSQAITIQQNNDPDHKQS